MKVKRSIVGAIFIVLSVINILFLVVGVLKGWYYVIPCCAFLGFYLILNGVKVIKKEDEKD